MITGTFQHRSGRVIALGRLALAGVFLCAIWLDPSQPSRFADETYAGLTAYTLWSALYLALTWNNWWVERRLALFAHLVDIGTFGLMVYLTEGYTSPFFTFFVFILLAATIKWGWRETAMTAAAVSLVFFLAGFAALDWTTGDIEFRRLAFRFTYLVVLSLVLIWFGINQRRSARSLAIELIEPERPSEPPIGKAMALAAERLGARRVVFAWWDPEEPWFLVAEMGPDGLSEQRIGPGESGSLVATELEGVPFLFDLEHGRLLRLENDGKWRLDRRDHAVDAGFAERFRIGSGVAVPVHSDLVQGILFLLDVPGLCTDDLEIAADLGAEISAALERTSAIALFEETAATRTRLSLTRDLHDSVIQLLAGTSYRLEGIRRSARAGRDVETEVDALQQELDQEQSDLRAFIAQLRRDAPPTAFPDLRETLRLLTERLARQWDIDLELLHCPDRLRPPEPMTHAVRQLMREAVANAVRHGKATRVQATVQAGESGLSLVIADNGQGFQSANDDDAPARPWSLHERVQELGGTLSLYSTGEGSRIIVSLPYVGAA
jgi:signal transduction histidine kinase